MGEITVGEYLSLKAKKDILFNGLQWCLSTKQNTLKISQAAFEFGLIKTEIASIESDLRKKLNKKTVANATA